MQIYVHRDGRDLGPFTREEVNEHLAAGSLSPSDAAWREGLPEWSTVEALVGLPPSVASRSRRPLFAAAAVGVAALAIVGALLLRGGDEGNQTRNTKPAGNDGASTAPPSVAPFDAGKVATKASLDFGRMKGFLEKHCYDCHDADMKEGGLDLDALDRDLDNPATLAEWVLLHDRVRNGEMPPKKKNAPPADELEGFLSELGASLAGAHVKRRGTVLRRLNRVEYANTLNDLFGTRVDIVPMLPEDGRAHEFENVGAALSISMVQLEKYLSAMDMVLDAAIADAVEPPKPLVVKATYAESREGKQHIGKVWGQNEDGAVVFFKRSGYPTGMLRGANTREAGRYRIRVTGYAHRSDQPITFSLGATTFQRGAEKPTFGYFSMPPGQPTTVETEAWIDSNYMIQIEPHGITDRDNELRKLGAKKYPGPGLAILQVELEGPLIDEFPSRGHRLLFDGVKRVEIPPRNPRDRQRRGYQAKFKIESADPVADATRVLSRVAAKAFRRSVDDGVTAPYVRLFLAETEKGADFETALRTAVSAIFCAPDFLYLRERPGRLDDFALAARLAYFLTRTTPDDRLLAAAAAGRLTGDGDALRAETERLLADPRSERFITDFTDAWLDLRSIEFTNPDRKLYPEFDEFLKFSMLEETRAFFRQLLRENLGVENVIESDFAMLNSRLAAHYDVPGVTGPEFRKVSLPDGSPRGGLMAHASVLKVSANGTTTSPVLRGVWVLERLLGVAPPPPPPAVPGVEPDIRGAQTIRQLLDKHRSMVSCQGCHQLIDPPGFALEVFDPIGGYRERFRSIGEGDRVDRFVDGRRVNYRLGPAVDAGGELKDGRAFKDFKDFKKLLLDRPRQVTECVTEKLLTFATGREMGFSDRAEIEHLVGELERNGNGLRTLAHLIVGSTIFRSK